MEGTDIRARGAKGRGVVEGRGEEVGLVWCVGRGEEGTGGSVSVRGGSSGLAG